MIRIMRIRDKIRLDLLIMRPNRMGGAGALSLWHAGFEKKEAAGKKTREGGGMMGESRGKEVGREGVARVLLFVCYLFPICLQIQIQFQINRSPLSNPKLHPPSPQATCRIVATFPRVAPAEGGEEVVTVIIRISLDSHRLGNEACLA